jgi:phage host-nuclease inhibitor protein Gam
MVKVKSKSLQIQAAQSREEAADMIRRLGEAQRNLLRIEAAMNDQLAHVKQVFEEQAQPLKERAGELQSGVQAWCEAHRDELTRMGKVKFHDFSTGQVSWRLRPPSVSLRGKEDIITACEEAGLRTFLRVKTEINKEAMLEKPALAGGLKGVTIKSAGEDFSIEPFEMELSE